jgi:L-lactate dehydrogenase complex protein LldG
MAKDVLKRLEETSREKQAAFIERIAQRLGRPPVTQKPPHPYQGAPDFWKQYKLSANDAVTLFSERWKEAGGHLVRAANASEARQWIVDKTRELQAKRLLRQNEPELEALQLEASLQETEIIVWDAVPRQERLAAAANADIGLVAADAAVAHTASILVTSSALKGRSVSLLPAVLFILLPAERIRTRLGEVLRTFDEIPREELPAGIHFISGPSRSSDIENDLTIGVHGPGVVFAIMIG